MYKFEPKSRQRAAPTLLSRDAIISAANNLMKQSGLESITMRRLSASLNTGPSSLYVYFRNIDELHSALLETILGEARLYSSAQDWQMQLTDLMTAYTSLLLKNPGLARAAQVSRPIGPNYLRMVERLLDLLLSGDTPTDRAAWGVNLLLSHATAIAAEHSRRGTRQSAADNIDILRLVFEGLSPTAYPHISRSREELVSGSPNDRIRWEFQTLLNGITSTAITKS